jgi:hypothetical protein
MSHVFFFLNAKYRLLKKYENNLRTELVYTTAIIIITIIISSNSSSIFIIASRSSIYS